MSLARMSRATLLAAFLGALLLATPVTARRSLFEVAHDHDEHERCECVAKEEGWKIDCTTTTHITNANTYLTTAANDCKKKDASPTCCTNYHIVQSHHDHCTHEQVPDILETTIHAYESFYEDCEIARQYDKDLDPCPTVTCSTAKVDLASVTTDLQTAGAGNVDCKNSEAICKASSTCKTLFQKVLMAHDSCDEDDIPAAIENTLHAYEEKCHDHFCNSVTEAFTLDDSTCPAHSGAAAQRALSLAAIVAAIFAVVLVGA